MDKNLNYRLNLKDFFKKTMLQAAESTKKLDTGMNKLNNTISSVGAGVAAYFSGQALLGFGNSVIESLKNYEYFSASIRTLMHGDRLSAKALEGQLVKLATTTPFKLTEVQDGSKQLLAYGFQAGKITDNLKMLGDVASGVGAPLNDVIYLYGTLKTQGRAYTKDIMQFTGRGIPIIRELAKQFKTTESNVQKLVEGGKIGFPQIEQAFRSMTSSGGDFFNMMNEQNNTIGGRLSALADSWDQLKVHIGTSQTGMISGVTSWATKMVSMVDKVLNTTNQMSAAFEKYGAKDFTFAQQKGSMLSGLFPFLKSNVREAEKEFESLQRYAEKSSGNLIESLSLKSALLQDRGNLSKMFADGKIKDVDYKRRYAMLSAGIDTVQGNIGLLRATPQKGGNENEGGAAAAGIGSATEISAGRPQNVNIHIEKFGVIEKLEYAGDLKETAQKVKSEWSKELLEILNDANLMARR